MDRKTAEISLMKPAALVRNNGIRCRCFTPMMPWSLITGAGITRISPMEVGKEALEHKQVLSALFMDDARTHNLWSEGLLVALNFMWKMFMDIAIISYLKVSELSLFCPKAGLKGWFMLCLTDLSQLFKHVIQCDLSLWYSFSHYYKCNDAWLTIIVMA